MQAWHAFLQDPNIQEHPAVIVNGTVTHFGNLAVEPNAPLNNTVLCDLSHLGLLEIEGADALNFLQGQLTNDIKLLNGNNAQYAAYCNPKGRMLAFFLAFADNKGHVHLQLPKSLIESIAKRLKMFVMRSKVSIQDQSDNIIKMGISGPEATAFLLALFNAVPTKDYEVMQHEQATLIKLSGTHPRYQILTSAEHGVLIWQALAKSARPVGADTWEWLEIQAGIPTITPATQEAFVPQMLNLDALDAINYKKGCYTGQEIVARTHYLGKVKRRTQLARLNSATAPSIGDDVMDEAQQIVGKIVRVAPNNIALSAENNYSLLVECRLESLATSAETALSNESNILESQALAKAPALFWQGHAIEVEPLPYALAT